MDKKTIGIEILVAVILGFVVGMIFLLIGATYGGNNPVPSFMGLPGYEGAGAFGAMLGMPLGGILGAYLVRRLRSSSMQKMSQAMIVGLITGVVLFLVLFGSNLFA